jgi:hypothetical protein
MKSSLFFLIAAQLIAQAPPHDHAAMLAAAHKNDPAQFLMQQASGTSMNPKSWIMPMISVKSGAWTLYVHGPSLRDRHPAIRPSRW